MYKCVNSLNANSRNPEKKTNLCVKKRQFSNSPFQYAKSKLTEKSQSQKSQYNLYIRMYIYLPFLIFHQLVTTTI